MSMNNNANVAFYLGVDVGTNSVRIVAIDRKGGNLIGSAEYPLKIWNPQPDFYEQSSDQIWSAVCLAVRKLLVDYNLEKENVRGIGFDATCSLVVLDTNGCSISLNSPKELERSFETKDDLKWNIIMWMDHRADKEAKFINDTIDKDKLDRVGGKMSLEMQPPKILWMKKNVPDIYRNVGFFMDLTDYLTFKATGSHRRSLCCTICKWMYGINKDNANSWDANFYEQIRLRRLTENNFWKIGPTMSNPGSALDRGLTDSSAQDLGLLVGTPVATGMIDAHAGCLGILFTKTGDRQVGKLLSVVSRVRAVVSVPQYYELPLYQIDELPVTEKLALICGTSTCHMAFTRNPVHVPGVWGPYPDVVFPGLYLLEAGQSSVGPILDEMAKKCYLMVEKLPVYHNQISTKMIKYQKLMCQKLDEHVENHGMVTTLALAENIHVWPDYYGNRSPYADSTMKGAILGMKMESTDYCGGVEYAIGLYLAHVQAMALMTRLIMETIEGKTSQKFKALHLCGGLQRNAYFVQAHSDVCQLPVVVTESARDEPVARGAAVLGATASGDFCTLEDAAAGLGARGRLVKPNRLMIDYYERKYDIFSKIGKLMLDVGKNTKSE